MKGEFCLVQALWLINIASDKEHLLVNENQITISNNRIPLLGGYPSKTKFWVLISRIDKKNLPLGGVMCYKGDQKSHYIIN